MSELETLCNALAEHGFAVRLTRFHHIDIYRWCCRLPNGVLSHHPEGYGDTALGAVIAAASKDAVRRCLERAPTSENEQ